MESVTEQLERERSQNSEYKMKLHRLETEYNSYVSNENELLEVNARLKVEVDRYTEEVRRCRDEVSRGKEATERGLAEQKASWMEEKFNLQRRVDELEDQLSQTQVKLATAGTDQKKVGPFHYKDCLSMYRIHITKIILPLYRKTSNIRRTLVCSKIVDHWDVVGASPVGAAPTTSSFST